MYHVHTSTLSSSTTTTEPVSTLSPSVLFPFFQPSAAASSTTSSCPPPSAFSPAHHSTTTTSSSSSCPCHSSNLLPPPATAPPTFISLPSANPQQSVILPLPQPSPPPATAAASPFSPPPSVSSASDPAAASSSSPTSASGKSPLLVFSHGSTQVDTFVPSSSCLQRTLYSWSQLSDYSTKYCWNLPLASSSSTQSTPAAGQPLGQNVCINSNNGRICQGEEVGSCPGHPWVNFSYHMQVKQWQERKEDAAAAALAQQQLNPAASTVPTAAAGYHMSDMGVKGLEVRVAAPSDILVEGVRRHRQHDGHGQQQYSDVDSDVGSMFDDVADGDDADEEDDNWNELCSTTDEDDECELTDVGM